MDEMNLALILWGISLVSCGIACIGIYLIFIGCKTISDLIDRVKGKKLAMAIIGVSIVVTLVSSEWIKIVL